MSERPSLTVTKFIRARRDRVFAAWTTADVLKQWFCPPELTVRDANVDARVGGQFHATMVGLGQTHTARGVFREVVPSQRLVMTHRWDEPQALETLLTVEFDERDGGTEITLTHAQLRNEEVARRHQQGWQGTLDHLERYLAEQESR